MSKETKMNPIPKRRGRPPKVKLLTSDQLISTLAESVYGPTYEKIDKIMMKADDIQVGADHYRSKTVQPWAAMESWLSKEEFVGFLRGNAIKYLARCNDKGGIEDVKKAQHYIQKMLEVLDGR